MADPPTRFFKFVPPGFLFNLSIPTSFLTKLNIKRCSKATLRRGHHEWSVGINDDGVFGEGWRRFVRENAVQEFDFIVFKHQGGMVFDFMVFDQSTCERQYPNLLSSDEMDVEEEEPLTVTESDMTRTHMPKKLKKRKRNDYASHDQDQQEKFQADDSGCFMSKMTSYVIRKSRLHVPNKFARSNGLITQKIHTQVYLMDDTGRTWPATLTKTKLEICLTGWSQFIEKNHLNVGDVCRFELLKHGEVPVFKCYSLRKNFVKNHIQEKEISSSNLNNHPYFISNLMPTSFKRSILYIPIDFSSTNGLKTGEMILRDNKCRSWKVHLKEMRKRCLYIGRGIKPFLVGNGMKEGDAFKFELVEKEKDKPPIVKFLVLKSKPIKSYEEAKPAQREQQPTLCKDDVSYYFGKLASYSIKQSLLYLPKWFVVLNGLLNIKRMTLKNVEDERSWDVELKNFKSKFYYIGLGWREFRVANGLKEGDHFKIKLVDKGEKPIIHFYLQRNC